MLELGLGAQEVLAAGGSGKVVAVFSKAAYLRLPAGLVALATTDVPAGPIHARGPFRIDRLVAGESLAVAGSVAGVRLAGARIWRGTLPPPAELAGGVALDLLRRAPPSALSAYPDHVVRAVEHLDAGDLAGVVDALAGLGPGLTPAGDDALAGILLVMGAHQPEAAVAAADRAMTNDIARAFLAWAARGQSIEPVHRLLAASGEHDVAGAEAALAGLLAVGHSSGADLACGLRLALSCTYCRSRITSF